MRVSEGLTCSAQAKLGDAKQSIRELESALRAKPDFVEAWYQMGVTLLSLGRAAEAEKALAEATRLRPDEAAIRGAWAAALEKAGQTALAAEQRRLAGADLKVRAR